MPAQRSLLGVPVSLQTLPRRFQLLLAFVVLIIVSLFVIGPPSPTDLPSYEQISNAVKNPHIPDLPALPELPELPALPDLPAVPKPFGPSAHQPAVQANSTASSKYGAIKWFTDFKWRNPLSSSVTMDENRAVLPPLNERPPIYTFYEPKSKQDKKITEAENRLILAWRRAWWAQGFKPQVLSRAESMKHPQYILAQRLKLDPKVEMEIMRWFAWGHMGGGILANWLAFPMADFDNPMLTFLRRKEYPHLAKVESMNTGVFFGQGVTVNEAIRKVMNNELLKNATDNMDKIAALAQKDGGAFVNLLSAKDVATDNKANGIAYYSTETINKSYKTFAEKLTNATLEGLDLLADLINSHLHLTFQETYSSGVIVVKPLPEHTTALMYEAIDIARNLTQCPSTPEPKSCPPNRKDCTPCDPNKPKKLQLQPSYLNASNIFAIGTVPHPYTLNSLHYTRDALDANFLRNNAERDMWLTALTDATLGPQHSDEARLVAFKEAVAAPHTIPHALWLTAERETQTDLDWVFGFNLPQRASLNTETISSDTSLIIFPRPNPPDPIRDVLVSEERWVRKEEERLRKSREILQNQGKHTQSVVEAVEQWNMNDTEAWKFARAFSARRRMERLVWEKEEKKFAGSEKKAGIKGGQGGGRYID